MNKIIGSGLLAAAFIEAIDVNALFFCSGVSDSNETRRVEFEREKALLIESLNHCKSEIFIYFSSAQADQYGTPYYQHKKKMEELIECSGKNYLIARLPQVVGVNNNKTIFPSFIRWLYRGQEITVLRNASRSLVDIDDVVRLVSWLVKQRVRNVTLNVASPHSISPLQLVTEIAEVLNIDPNLRILNSGEKQNIDIKLLRKYIDTTDVLLSQGYTQNVVRKYALQVLHLIEEAELGD